MGLIRVFEIPHDDRMAKNYLFRGGYPVVFLQVDWFRDDHFPLNPESQNKYISFIEGKVYANSARTRGAALLVLGQDHSFTINYRAP